MTPIKWQKEGKSRSDKIDGINRIGKKNSSLVFTQIKRKLSILAYKYVIYCFEYVIEIM